MDTMTKEPEDDLIERLFYEQLVWKFDAEFVEAANNLGVSNEALERAATEMAGNGSLGAAFAHFCRHTITHRRLGLLVGLMQPGEECVSLVDLVKRETRLKGDA
jgi:hypothetical protein